MCEAKRIAVKLEAQLVLIHAGTKSEKNEEKMRSILSKVKIDENAVKIIWQEGDPVEVLSVSCVDEEVDLLVLGAIQNENFFRYYLGSVARKIARKPPCSLLLVTNPQQTESRLNSIVVNGIDHSKTKNTIHFAFDFSRQLEAKEIFVVEEVNPKNIKIKIEDSKTLEKANNEKDKRRGEEQERIEKIINETENKGKEQITNLCVFGKVGYTIAHFAQVKNADLLVLNSPDSRMGLIDKIFPHDIEYVLSDLPCDLMIVR